MALAGLAMAFLDYRSSPIFERASSLSLLILLELFLTNFFDLIFLFSNSLVNLATSLLY